MSPFDVLNHLLNFAAPALALALLLPLCVPTLMKKSPAALSFWAQAAINFVVGLAVLLICLWVLGRDGKMAAYAALVAAAATSQWVLARAWQR